MESESLRMALLDILQRLAADCGYNIKDINERDSVVSKINKAALEIYQMTDLPGSLDEQIFNLAVDATEVVLPAHVAEARYGRYVNTQENIQFEHQLNRYNFPGIYNKACAFKFQRKSTSCLTKTIANQSILKFYMPLPMAEDIVISIQGPTDRATQCREKVILVSGETEAVSLENFKSPLKSLRKSHITESDIIVYDVEDNEIGIIPNNQRYSRHTIWQIQDDTDGLLQIADSSVEVIYKKAFVPLEEDEDQFLDCDDFDMAVIFKVKEHIAQNDIAMTLMNKKCNQAVNIAISDKDPGTNIKRISIKPSPYIRPPYKY
jgi:hypothetical protein